LHKEAEVPKFWGLLRNLLEFAEVMFGSYG